VELRGLEPLTPCLQSTSRLSEAVSHVAIDGSGVRSQTASVGLRCGQGWWSGSRDGSKNSVKPILTVTPSSRSQLLMRTLQDHSAPELGIIVHRRLLAAVVRGSSSYSVGYPAPSACLGGPSTGREIPYNGVSLHREVTVCGLLRIYCARRSERATSKGGLRSGASIYETTFWLTWRNKLICMP
jgi:hypothetical protein